MSYLSRYCLGLIESTCLGLLAVLPVYFNRHSEKMFEPDKIALFRSVSLLLLAAWVVRAAEGRGGTARTLWGTLRTPLAVALLIPAVACGVAACFSVDRLISWWGSYDNCAGVYTFLFSLLLCATVAGYLRRAIQADRFVRVILAANLPVALYALLQRAGYDPIHFARQDPRAFATMGQPVYLGAYLGMVFPFTLWRIWTMWQTWRLPTGSTAMAPVTLALYLLLGLIQLFALVLTESRGPFLGVLAGTGFFALLLAAVQQNRRLGLGALALVASPLLLLLVLNMRAHPFERLRSMPVLGRYLSVFRPGEGTGSFRTDLWRYAPALLSAKAPLAFPEGGTDRYHRWRPLIGYGPETLAGVLPRFYSGPGVEPRLENRFHNLTWDLWASTGAFGVAGFLAPLVLVFLYAYRALGLVSNRTDTTWFAGLLVIGTSTGALILIGWLGLGYAGLGLQTGLVAGLAAYPVLRLMRKPAAGEPAARPEENSMLLSASLGVMAGHIVETGFSFEVAPTTLLYWGCMGLSFALIRLLDANPQGEQQSPAPEILPQGVRKKRPLAKAHSTPPSTLREAAFSSIMAALILVPLLSGFIHVYSYQDQSPSEILRLSLTLLDGRGEETTLTIPLLLLAWLGVAWILTSQHPDRTTTSKPTLGRFKLTLVSSGVLLAAYALFKALELSVLGPFPRGGASASLVLHKCAGYEWLAIGLIAMILGLIVCNGFCCSPDHAEPVRKTGLRQSIVGLVAGCAALLTAWFTNINSVRADVCLHWAEALHTQRVDPASISTYERAVRLCPTTYFYYSKLAEALRSQAQAAGSDPQFDEWMARAARALIDAQTMGTLNRGSYHLGELYASWAAHEKDPAKRLARARQASQAFDRALIFEPHSASGWLASADLDESFLDRPDKAREKRARAQELARSLR